MFNGATVHGIAGIRGLRHPAEIPLLIAAVVTTALGYIGWFGLVTWLVTVPEPTGLSAEIREQILGGGTISEAILAIPLIPLLVWIIRALTYGWGLVVDAPLVGGVFCVWDWGWSGCASGCGGACGGW